MRGFLLTAAAVLVAIGFGIGVVAVVWSPPSYRANGLVMTADFPGTPRMARASVAGVQATEWVASAPGTELIVTIMSPKAFYVSSRDLTVLDTRLDQRLGGHHLFSFGRPETHACGPLTGRLVIGGEPAEFTTTGRVFPPGVHMKAHDCQGMLSASVHGQLVDAIALGTKSEVRSLFDSIRFRP